MTDLNKDAQVQYGLPQVRPWPSDHSAVLPAARGRQVQPGADVSSGSKLDEEWTGSVDIVGLDNSQMVEFDDVSAAPLDPGAGFHEELATTG